MSETAVKKSVCPNCDKDIRPDAAFCYHCGGSLDFKDEEEASDEMSDVWFRGNISENEKSSEEPEKVEDEVDEPSEKETDSKSETNETETDSETKKQKEEKVVEDDSSEKAKTETQDKKDVAEKIESKKNKVRSKHKTKPLKPNLKLKSAATLRKKNRPARNQKVEVVWEEHESSSSLGLLITTIIFAALGVGMFFLAMYLK